MKLYLVRHGQSQHNEMSLHQHSDVELSKLGIRQSKILAKRLSKIPIDLIYSSPLKRVKNTAGIISQVIKKEAIYLDFLKEKFFGNCRKKKGIMKKFRKFIKK